MRRAYETIERLQRRIEKYERARTEPIAIIGLGARFPGGVVDAESYWDLLSHGRDAVSEVPRNRWDVDAFYDKKPFQRGKSISRWGGYLDHIDRFDHDFFGISRREAVTMDPQHRLLLEVTWEALEDAGLAPRSLAGSQTGVFFGLCLSDYSSQVFRFAEEIEPHASSGNAHSIASGRISYLLDLRGPSVSIDTACSSSLVALHQAVQSLRAGEIDTAISGAANVVLSPCLNISYSQFPEMLAADGRCKTFDAAADGFVRSEGCGAVVLKRLSDALRDGDRIHAVVRGSALNQDGRSSGLTAPNGVAQQAVLRRALAVSGVKPEQLGYIETHGTGTRLGDPIEVEALAEVYGRREGAPLYLGSVKTNLGHMEAAAGMGGLIKAVLCLQHGMIPPNLHFNRLNPHISFDGTTFAVPTSITPWPREGARIAGLSSFGFSGTNAHVIIEQAPEVAPAVPDDRRPRSVLALSAKSEPALVELASRYQHRLAADAETPVADVCFSAGTSRGHFPHRLAVAGGSAEQIAASLGDYVRGEDAPAVATGKVAADAATDVVFLFTGQGAQRAGMARALYDTQPAFRRVLERCDEILRPMLDHPLLSVIYPEAPDNNLINENAYAQPALFAVEYALAELWRSWGVEPTAVFGHSLGEYAAACFVGAMSLEDALRLVALRGQLMQQVAGSGAMATVFAAAEEVARELAAHDPAQISIAAINGPANTAISGTRKMVDTVVAAFAARGVKTRRLHIATSAHSPLIEPVLDPLRQALSSVEFAAPRTHIVSSMTGELWPWDKAPEVEYWCRHARQPVRFADGVASLHELGYRIFLEVGPAPTLLGLVGDILPADADLLMLPSLRPKSSDWEVLLESVSRLYVRGVEIDWAGFDREYARTRTPLPRYPFDSVSCWHEFGDATIPFSRTDTPVQAASNGPELFDAGERDGAADQRAARSTTPARGRASSLPTAKELLRSPAAERPDILMAHLTSSAVRALGTSSSKVDPDAPLSGLGLDSLMAVELRNEVRGRLGVSLAIADLLSSATIRTVSQQIAGQVTEVAGDGEEPDGATIRRADRGQDAAKILPVPIGQPTSGESLLPLSVFQQGMWFLEQLRPDNRAYVLPAALRIRGPFDLDILRDAVNDVVQRHEALRTTFQLCGGQPRQVVHASMPVELPEIDLRGEGLTDAELADRIVAEVLDEPMNIERGPLLRMRLLRLGADDSVLAVALHHLISDRWSFGILMSEIDTRYESALAGRPTALPELPVQYGDFAVWQQQQLRARRWDADLAYWREHLSGAPAALELPTDRSRPPVQGFNGEFVPIELPEPLMRRLGELARGNGATTYMALLAVFTILLHRYSNQDDIVVGVPAAMRARPEIESLIGYFVNALPIRTRLAGDPPFLDVLDQVRGATLGAYTHEEVPFDVVVAELNLPRDLSRSPVFQVSFSHGPEPDPTFTLGDTELTRLPVQSGGARFDLELSTFERDGALGGRFEYDRDLFDRATIERMAGHFRYLVEQVVADPTRPVGRLELVGPAERAQLLVAFNDTAREWPAEDGWIHQCFEAQAARRPEAEAVRFEGCSLTYGELNRRANQLAHRLIRSGVGRDVLVGVALERSIELVVALLAVLKAGGAYVPLDPEYPRARLAQMLAAARVPMLLTQRPVLPKLPAVDAELLCLEELDAELAVEPAENPDVPVDGEDLAYVIFTSGSTGVPKGVMNVHAGIRNRLLWMQHAFMLDGSDRVLQKTPYSFDVSVWEFFWPLMVGATLVVARPGGHRDPGYLRRTIRSERVTTIHFVPSMLQVFLQEPVEACTSLRRVICSGEALPRDLQDRFLERSTAELHNLYGPTEAAIDVTHWACRQGDADGPVPIGRAIANTQIYVLDRLLQPVPVGVAGELHIGGRNLARGYLGMPEMTEERFIAHPFDATSGARLYKTGDLARFRPDGAVEFLGRLDDQVKLRGFRVELGEIEAALAEHPRVHEAVVAAREHRPGDLRLVAYFTRVEPEAAPAPAELAAHLRQRLPEYMVPAYFEVLDAFPLTGSGKANRKALPEPASMRPDLAAEFVAPRDKTEDDLAAIWRDVLGVDRVGMHDNFFDLGGHSLLMARLRTELAARTGRDVSMVELFQHPTVASLADFLRQAPGREQALLRTAQESAEQRRHSAHRRRRADTQSRAAGGLRPDPTDEDDRIAIVGLAGRFPGAGDIEAFWAQLRDGVEGIATFTDEELAAGGVDADQRAQEGYVKAKGVLEGADEFDAGFFGFSPREAELLDPQHRVFMECVWDALEAAGCVPGSFPGRIGVFAGAGLNTYLLYNIMANRSAVDAAGRYQTMLASDEDFLATRVSYKLGLTGPSLTVQTACSTSLTAVHLACQSLLDGECDIAIAGGVAVSSPLCGGYLYEPGGILSSDGHCRPFDADAGGTVPGNGAGVVVLRRLADAREAGDRTVAVILATAINNDGSLKAGYTAPSVDGQAAVISEALALAGVSAESIGYVETHGTGTALGDPIEIAALTRAFSQDSDRTGYCAIGSVKSNVGHLDAAAGVTGLIKTALMLDREAMPPSLHFRQANPQLQLDTSPFFVNDQLRPWPRGEAPHRAGVSSFGIGGTNVHIVLEEAPEPDEAGAQPGGAQTADRQVLALPLSAKSPAALAAAARRLGDHIAAHPDLALGDVAHTLLHRRTAFGQRHAIVCRDRAEAVSALRRVGPGDAVTAAERGARVAFLFPGQGAQYVGMAHDLYAQEPVFAAEVDRCAGLFAPYLGTDLRELLYTPPVGTDAASALAQTRVTQPVLFTIEYALAQLWASWGVRPAAMAGHSIGEYVAASLAGVFDLPDAVRVVAERGRLVQEQPGGAMLTVFLSEPEILRLLAEEPADGLGIAAINSTGLGVVSGPHPAVDALAARLASAGIGHRRLHTSHAYHSASMQPAVGPLVDVLRTVTLRPPAIPFISDVTGDWITAEQATDPQYWGDHLRAPVRFAAAAEHLLDDSSLVFVEVGPGHTLDSFLRQHPSWRPGRTSAASMRHAQEQVDDRVVVHRALASLWAAGVPVDPAVLVPAAGRLVPLPTYPFQRQRFWIEPKPTAATPESRPRTAGVDEFFYTPGWQRLAVADTGAGAVQNISARAARDQVWVLIGEVGLGDALARRLSAAGASVVRPGKEVDLSSRADLSLLLKEQASATSRRLHLVYLAGLTSAQPAKAGFGDLFTLAQALAGVLPAIPAPPRPTRADQEQSSAEPVTLDVLCSGVYSVTGEELRRPEAAALTGVATVISQEFSNVVTRVLDIFGTDPHAPAAATVETLLAMLTREAGEAAEERTVALRGRYWWCREFRQIRLDPLPGGATRLRDGGVYLITGGLGGIGIALAEQIAARVARPVLALLGRSPFPAEQEWDGWLATHGDREPSAAIRRLRALRERGATVVVLSGDVTDAEQMAAHVAGLRERFGRLHGVIHSAGVPASGLIVTSTVEATERVFAAKVDGTLVLEQVCATDDLDFLLLCSSVTGVLGGPGQSDYAGANAFLDAFAEDRRERGVPVTSVAWGTWEGVGMARSLPGALGNGASAGTPTHHPMLNLLAVTDDRRTYSSTFSTAQSWIVNDHRIMGHGLVPGTAYLDLVYAALSEQDNGRIVDLHDVLFTEPVIVPDGQTRTIYTTIEARNGRLIFTVRSRNGADWREHASGSASFAEREQDATGQDTVDLDAVRAQCKATEVINTEEKLRVRYRIDKLAKGAGPLEFTFGPRWEVLREVRTDGERMFATLRLPDEFRTDLDEYPLHPAMLDIASGVFRMHAKDLYHLPLTYRRLRVLRPLTDAAYCAVVIKNPSGTSGETYTCDFDVIDTQGRLLVQATDFSVKRINDVAALAEQVAQPTPAATTDDAQPVAAGMLGAFLEGMSEQEGRDAFDRILAAAWLPSHLVVSASDFTALRRLAASITLARLNGEVNQLPPPTSTHPRPDLDTPYLAPSTAEEQALAEIWQQVLGIEQVGVNDDFFALGGHSLAAVQIGIQIHHRFGVELDLRSFFDGPTIAHTAAVLASADGAGGADDVIQALRRDDPGTELDNLDALSYEEAAARLLELLAEEDETR